MKLAVFPVAKMGFILDADFDTVVGNNKSSFVDSIQDQLSITLRDVMIFNISVEKGSIVAAFYIQSENRQDVIEAIDLFTSKDIFIKFNGQRYFVTNKATEFSGAAEKSDDEIRTEMIIIIAAVGGTAVVVLACILAYVYYRCYKRHHSRMWKIHAAASKDVRDNTNNYAIRDIYWQTSVRICQ